MKSKKELEEELANLNKLEKIMDVEDMVKEKKRGILKRRYKGVKAVLRMFVK